MQSHVATAADSSAEDDSSFPDGAKTGVTDGESKSSIDQVWTPCREAALVRSLTKSAWSAPESSAIP